MWHNTIHHLRSYIIVILFIDAIVIIFTIIGVIVSEKDVDGVERVLCIACFQLLWGAYTLQLASNQESHTICQRIHLIHQVCR